MSITKVTKTVSIDGDVFSAIDKLATETSLRFSHIANQLLREKLIDESKIERPAPENGTTNYTTDTGDVK